MFQGNQEVLGGEAFGGVHRVRGCTEESILTRFQMVMKRSVTPTNSHRNQARTTV